MSTILDTDIFLVQRGATQYQVAATGLKVGTATDIFLAQRGASQFQVPYSRLAQVADADLLLVQRGAVQHQVSGVDLKAYLGGAPEPELWTPADITMSLWLDGSDPLTRILAGSKVSEWRDKSGNNRHLSNTNDGTRPNNNALGIVGNEGFLSRTETAPAGVTNKAHFAVYRVDTSAFIATVVEGVSCFATWPTSPTSNFLFDTLIGDNVGKPDGLGLLYQPANNGADVTHSINATAARGLISMFAGYWDATSGTGVSAAWLNGVSAPDTTPADSTWPTTAFAGSQIVAAGRYLNLASAKGWNLYNELFCVIETTAPILIANREKLEGWAAHAFGITAQLPADHPYKNSPPTK